MRPDIMMVDLTTNDCSDIESRTLKRRKANKEQTILENGYIADTRYEDK